MANDHEHGRARAHGHGHGHGSLHLRPGSAAVARAVAIAVGVVLALTVVGVVGLWPRGDVTEAPGVVPGTEFVDGTVVAVHRAACPDAYQDPGITCGSARVRITSGPTRGDLADLPTTEGRPGAPVIREDDRLRLSYFADGPEGFEYAFVDFQRRTPLVALAAFFVVAVVLLARVQGVRALAGMALSLLVVIGFLLPALLRGGPPLVLALVAASVVAFLALYLAHGIHVGTHVAFLGSILALALTAGLGAAFVSLAHLTGLGDEDAVVLSVAAGDLDLRGLILAGLVVGALGVLDDITVTQVSAVAEIQAVAPESSAWDLYRSGLRIGRDHVASTVNTLVLAYVGATLPLMLLFSQGGRGAADVVTSELVATEVVRALVGSIGLVAAVPITTGLAAVVVHRWGAVPIEVDPMAAAVARARAEDDEDGVDGPWAGPDDDADFWSRR